MEILALKVQKVILVSLDLVVLLASKGFKVNRDLKETKAPRGHQDNLVQMVFLVPWDSLERQDLLEYKVKRASRAILVFLGQMELLELPEESVLPVSLDSKVNKAIEEWTDFKETLV